ncbi:MAG: carbonic anhydrase [Planctomycetota bacterium]
MSFCTAINCMDGRVQLPVNEWCRHHFNADYVDTITEPAPPSLMADPTNAAAIDSILRRVDVSVHQHGSKGIAIVAHTDCAGDPVDDDQCIVHLCRAVKVMRKAYPDLEVIGLWLGADWQVEPVACPV